MKMSGRHSVSIPPRRRACPGQSGQVLVFLVMALVIITMLILWHVDLNAILHLKSRTQNAGDAAALAAARWQGVTLNLIGDLNIMQALALSGGDTNAAAQIVEMQARLRYMGPLVGLVAAQQAAKHNGIYVNSAFSAMLLEHADDIREVYMDAASGFAEPWPGCWKLTPGFWRRSPGKGWRRRGTIPGVTKIIPVIMCCLTPVSRCHRGAGLVLVRAVQPGLVAVLHGLHVLAGADAIAGKGAESGGQRNFRVGLEHGAGCVARRRHHANQSERTGRRARFKFRACDDGGVGFRHHLDGI